MSQNEGLQSPFTPIGDVNQVDINKTSVTFHCTNALLKISLHDKHTFRIQATSLASFKETPSFIVLPSSKGKVGHLKVQETKSGWQLQSSTMHIQVQRSPCRISFLDLQGSTIVEDSQATGILFSPSQIQISKVLSEREHFYGFGHKTGSLDKRGSRMEMWNHYQMYDLAADPLSTCVPFFIAIRNGTAYGVYLDSPAKSIFDMGATDSSNYTITVNDAELDYYFIFGPDPKQVLYSYSQLTGQMPLPPRWILGYHQCRWSYTPATRVLEIASELRNRRIPCDGIWIDIDYMDGYRVFTWNSQTFPEPQAMIEKLRANGFKVITIIDPGVKVDDQYTIYQEGLKHDYFLRKENDELFIGTAWPTQSVFPNFLHPAVREWWANLHKPLLDIGISAIWDDLNEPQVFLTREYEEMAKTIHTDGQRTYTNAEAHNLYGLAMVQATYNGMRRLRPSTRPWILSRAGWAGIQRYAAVWTHDNHSTWEHLEQTVPQLLNLGMAGIPLVGSDIGGFYEGPTAELFARWNQLGVFSPFCRNHTANGTPNQEPWEFGPEVEEISRRFISFRYMLLPYLYDTTREASLTGVPIMRPLVLEFPTDEHCHRIEDQFLIGPAILVAPVLQEGLTSRQVYLPEGDWFDPHSQKTYRGPITIKISTSLAVCPTFIRRGSILPLHPVVQHSDEPVDQLQLDIYPCVDCEDGVEYCHYEDDYESLDYQNGNYITTQYWCHTVSDGVTFIIQQPEGSYKPPDRKYALIFRCLGQPPKQIILDGEPLESISDEATYNESEVGWFWQTRDQTVRMVFPDTRKRREVQLKV
jgi:alpha-glucosidase